MLTASAACPSRCLLIALALSLTACATPSPTLPPPPIVRCEQGKTPPVSDPPADWWADGPAWAVEVLGVLRQERAYRKAEHECLSRLRSQSVIR